jgi:hypothetical protein
MLGAGGRRVKAAPLLALALAACFWRGYGRLAATHAELLAAIARKGYDLVAAGRLTAESMPELTYPLERAQAFVADAGRRAGSARPPSLGALETLVERYRRFIDVLDRVRRARTTAGRRELAARLREVRAAARQTRAALRAEHRI